MRLVPNGVCLLCDEPAQSVCNLCDACARELPALSDPCIVCGASAVPHTKLCRSCAMRAPCVDRTICALAYAPPVDYLVGRLKFGRDLRVVPALAGVLDRMVAEEASVDWLAPVPIAPARLRQRGFNQALEIARYLGKRHAIPLAPIKMRQFIFTHTSGPVPRHAVLGVGGCPITRGRGSARGLVQCRRGRTAEQREPVVDPLSGQALVSAGPLVPSPAPRAQIEPGTEQVEKALSGALVDVEIGA